MALSAPHSLDKCLLMAMDASRRERERRLRTAAIESQNSSPGKCQLDSNLKRFQVNELEIDFFTQELNKELNFTFSKKPKQPILFQKDLIFHSFELSWSLYNLQ